MGFAIFPLHLSKVLRLPRKSDARSYEVPHLSRKIIFANLTIWCSKMQPFSGNQRPDPLTSLMSMSLVLRLPRDMHLCRSSSNVPRLPWFFGNATIPSQFAPFWQGAQSLAPATRNDIWTSKSAPYPSVLNTCDFEMCFAQQRRALFRHLNLQRWSETVSFLNFWLQCASRQNGVHFFIISTSKGGLRPSVFFLHFWLRNVLQNDLTVANGCGRLRPQTQRRANTPSTPRPPEWNGDPCYAFGNITFGFFCNQTAFFSDRTWLPQFMLPNVYVFLPFDGGSMCASLNPFKCIWHESARTASLVTQRSALMLDKNYWRNNMQNLCWSESLFFELFDMYGFVWA